MNFSIPRVPRALVARDEVARRLDVMSGLTHIRTLGGCGATTLVAWWARQRRSQGDAVVWCDQHAGIGEFDQAVQHISELSTTAILVLDNARLARDGEVVDRVCQIVKRHEQVNVVVIGESPLLRDKARHYGLDRTVISARDMIVTVEQAHEFARSCGYEVSGEVLRDAHRIVGGHVLGLRIALSGNATISDSPDKDGACAYFRHDVVAKASDDRLITLAALSSLTEAITAPIVEELIDLISLGTTAEQALSDLVALGLIHRATGDSDHWECAPAVAEALSAHVHAHDPEMVTRAHEAIARSILGAGGPAGPAVVHARYAGLWSVLAEVWVRESVVLFERFPRHACEAFGALPSRAVRERPVLAVAEGWARAARLEVLGHRALASAVRDVRVPVDGANPAEVLADATARIMLRRQSGDVTGALRLAADLEQVAAQQGATRTVDWFNFQWAVTDLLAGHQAAANRRFSRLCSGLTDREHTGITRAAAAHLAMMRAITGELDAARHWLDECQTSSEDPAWLAAWTQTPQLVARIVLGVDEGDLDQARACLDELGSPTHEELWSCIVFAATHLEIASGSPLAARNRLEHGVNLHRAHMVGESLARRIVVLCRCEVGLAMGEVNRVEALLSRCGPTRWLWSVESRLRLISGEVATALELSETARIHPGISPRERVDHAFIVAAALQALGHYEKSRDATLEAHALARATGMVTACRKVPAAACTQVCDRDPSERDIYPVRAELVTLTPREREVLSLMRQYDSLAEVASALTVSVNTVKKQSVSIHAKLGVKDRSAAVMRAEALGLLDSSDDLLFEQS